WLRKYRWALPFNYDNYTAFYKDGGYGNIFSRIFTHGSYVDDFYIEKYDSLGRICPDYTIPNVDTTTSVRKYAVTDVQYSLIKDSFTSEDIGFYDSAVNEETVICKG